MCEMQLECTLWRQTLPMCLHIVVLHVSNMYPFRYCENKTRKTIGNKQEKEEKGENKFKTGKREGMCVWMWRAVDFLNSMALSGVTWCQRGERCTCYS